MTQIIFLTRMTLVIILALSSVSLASTPLCEVVIKASASVRERILKDGQQIFKSHDGKRELVYKYFPPKTPGQLTLVFVHGLGDSMSDMKPLYEKSLALGQGVLLMDQYGHGETLELSLSQHSAENPLKDYDYMNNSKDLHDLIVDQDITNFYLVGHSLGGNVVFYTAAEFASRNETSKFKLRGVVPMAPYAGRGDKYLVDYLRSPEYWIEEPSTKAIKAGVDGKTVDAILDPYYRILAMLKQYPKFMQDVFYNLLGVQKLKDMMQDPLMDEILKTKYREYFIAKAEKEKGTSLTEKDLQEVEIKVEVSLGITKINRSIDLLNSLQDIPKIDVPILILAARNDLVVRTSQMKELKLRLEKEKLDVDLLILDGKDAEHFFPQKMSNQVFDTILDFIKKTFKKE